MAFADVRGGALRVYGRGARRAIFAAGWLGTAADWSACLAALDPDRISVGLFEFRGYGVRRETEGAYTFLEAAREILDAADQLGWNHFALVGHSMGAMMMQRVPLLAPGRVDRLVGIAPVPACGAKMPSERLAVFERAVHDLPTRTEVIAASTGRRLSSAWCDTVARHSLDRSSRQAVSAYLDEWARSGFDRELRSMPPASVLVGEHDPSLTASVMTATWGQWYPRLDIEAVPNAGHYPLLETPAWLGTRLQALLSADAA